MLLFFVIKNFLEPNSKKSEEEKNKKDNPKENF